MSKLTIMVQSYNRMSFTTNYYVEWSETVHSWQAAWKVLDGCSYPHSEAVKREVSPGLWVLSLGLPEAD